MGPKSLLQSPFTNFVITDISDYNVMKTTFEVGLNE